MAQFVGNFRDFLKSEVKRLRNTEEPTVSEEIVRLQNLPDLRKISNENLLLKKEKINKKYGKGKSKKKNTK